MKVLDGLSCVVIGCTSFWKFEGISCLRHKSKCVRVLTNKRLCWRQEHISMIKMSILPTTWIQPETDDAWNGQMWRTHVPSVYNRLAVSKLPKFYSIISFADNESVASIVLKPHRLSRKKNMDPCRVFCRLRCLRPQPRFFCRINQGIPFWRHEDQFSPLLQWDRQAQDDDKILVKNIALRLDIRQGYCDQELRLNDKDM